MRRSPTSHPHRSQVALRCVLLACAFRLTAGVCAQPPSVVVHLLDGRSQRLQLEAVRFEAPNYRLIRGRAGDRGMEFPADEIWQIDFERGAVSRGSIERIWLRDGSRLSGRMVRGGEYAGQPFNYWFDFYEQTGRGLESIAGLTREDPPPGRLPAGVGGEDVLRTLDGDRLVGRLVRLTDDQFLFRSDLGTLTIARSRLKSLVLAQSDAPPEEPAEKWLLHFVNGDRLVTDAWGRKDQNEIEFRVAGVWQRTPFDLLSRALRIGKNTIRLSNRQPERFRMEPILAGTRAITVDEAPGNRPLRVGDRQYAFGLFLRPNCEMEWTMGPNAQRFVAELGIDSAVGNGARATVSIQVRDGDWSGYTLEGNAEPKRIQLALQPGGALRLRVRSDEPWGSGAQVVLGEPMVTRVK